MKLFIITLALAVITGLGYSQSQPSISPSVYNSAGSQLQTINGGMDINIGEPLTALISDNGLTITQGLLQPVYITIINVTSFNVKMFIQGYYLGGGLMNQVLYNEGVDFDPNSTNVDTVTVSLIDPVLLAADPLDNATLADTVATAKGVLQTNGSLTVSFPSRVAGNRYYLMLTHRNALQTWSANTVIITNGGFYDFTNALNKAYRHNMASLGDGNYALYSGDMNQDQNIDIYDFPAYDYDVSHFYYGYFNTDLNGDGNVDIYDFPVFDANSHNFVYSIHP